jgi:hypothetical protein
MESIENAINNCQFGVCFTNDRLTTSKIARTEVELLLNHIGADKIVEIALPREPLPHRLFPELSAAMGLEVPVSSTMLTCNVVDTILQHIQKHTGMTLCGCNCGPLGEPNRRTYRSRGVRYSLDISGWTVMPSGCLTRIIGWGGGDSIGPMFSRTFPGGHLWGHVIVGTQDIPRKKLRIGSSDDRDYYEEALKFAAHFFGNTWKQQCLGVHLIFVEDLSHPAFTTLARSGMAVIMGNPVWSRLYSVVLKGRWEQSRDLEFAFFFFFRGDLKSFLRSAHVMDRLVLSFNREIR